MLDKIRYTHPPHKRVTITIKGIEMMHGRIFTVKPADVKIFRKKMCTRKIQKDDLDPKIKNEEAFAGIDLKSKAVQYPKNACREKRCA